MLVAEIESVLACNPGIFCPKLHRKVDFVPAVTLKYLITKSSVDHHVIRNRMLHNSL